MTDIQHDFSSDWCATPELGAQNDHPPASNYCNLAIILAKAWFMACLLVFWEATADLMIVWTHFWRPESWRGELLPERDELLLLLLLDKLPLHECTATLQCRQKRTNTHNTYKHNT